MNWLKRKIRRWLDSEQDITIDEGRYATVSPKNSIGGRDVNSDPTLMFKIYNARGGKIVEFSRYDRQKDRNAVSYTHLTLPTKRIV